MAAESPRSKLKGTPAGLLVAALVLGAIFGGPPLVRYLKAPNISESFGLEDAVVAMRLQAKGISYLSLVNEAGEMRSVRLDERGFENSMLAWSDAGLSTGDPGNEFLLHKVGLVKMPFDEPQESPSERHRLVNKDGFVVFSGSPHGQQLVFVGASAGEMVTIDAGYVNPELASCGDSVVMVGENGIDEVTRETQDFDHDGIFDDVQSLVCADDRVFGLGLLTDAAPQQQLLRVWNEKVGAPVEYLVRYPEEVLWSVPSSMFVQDGRLYWTLDWRLWSVDLPDPIGSDTEFVPVLEAEETAWLGDSVSTEDSVRHDAIVGVDGGVLALGGERVFSVAADEKWVKPRRARSYDKLKGMMIYSLDPATGEQRVEIEIDKIDVPRRDLRVHAIAVDQEWAASR